MKITRDNYEQYLVDYWDNTLPNDTRDQLEVFLLENPDIREEMEGAGEMVLSQSEIVLDTKKNLHSDWIIKTAEVNELDTLLVAELEGDLSAEQARKLDTFRKDAHVQAQRKLFARTKLKPEPIVFREKNSLRHRTINLYWAYGVAAAALVVALMVSGVFNTQSLPENGKLAQVTEERTQINPEDEPKAEMLAQVTPEAKPTVAEQPDELPIVKRSAPRNKTHVEVVPSAKATRYEANHEEEIEYDVAMYEEEAPETASMMAYRECVQMPDARQVPAKLTPCLQKSGLSADLIRDNKIFRAYLKSKIQK